MKLTIALLVGVLALTFLLKTVESAKNYVADVAHRFVERLAYIPSETQRLLTRESLAKWLADPKNADAVTGYVAPVLFPIDLLSLLLLGGLFGVGSTTFAGKLPMLGGTSSIWWILPLLYLVSDLAEDTMMAGIFKSFVRLTDASFQQLHALARIKIATAAIAEFGFLAALCVMLRISPASHA
jgi:hypothetical protein